MKQILALMLSSLVVFGAGCATYPTDTSAPTVSGGTTEDLSNRGLTAIPQSVFTRKEITTLDLSNNQLANAPQAEIRQLVNLVTLDLSGNKLTGLPAELGQLRKLETLDVSNNSLTGLPLELGNLTQLRILDVSNNPYSVKDLEQIASKLINTEIRR
ncbi:MAG: leucine-rich repeat domain-containing protein [bacterium]|nr:leucine-rich repeat domain-containing protein [bacterium]